VRPPSRDNRSFWFVALLLWVTILIGVIQHRDTLLWITAAVWVAVSFRMLYRAAGSSDPTLVRPFSGRPTEGEKVTEPTGWRRWTLPVFVGLLWGVGFPLLNALSGKASAAEAWVQGLILGPLWFIAFGFLAPWGRRRLPWPRSAL
jgi:hypothetical protein